MNRHVKITAKIISVVNTVPMLDAMLIKGMARRFPSAPHEKNDPAPTFDQIPPIPIASGFIGGQRVFRCSNPIVKVQRVDEEYCVQAFPREHADLLHDSTRNVLRVGQGDQKSMRLKYEQLSVSEIVWFASLHKSPSELRKELKKECLHVSSCSKRGRGRVIVWLVEIIDEDLSWFAKHPDGRTVLMRNLPKCSELPSDLCGYLEEYNACTPPYWHPQRKMTVVVPC